MGTERTFAVLLFKFALCISTICSLSAAQAPCQLTGGTQGVCVEIRQCPKVIEDLKRGIGLPVRCGGFNGRYPFVCCPSGSPNAPGVSDISPPRVNFDCGERSQLNARAGFINKPSVVGGIEALPRTWPWMVLLGDKDSTGANEWFCGGVLINDQWILTAAHCPDEKNITVVRLGEHNYEDPNDGTPHQDFEVETIIRNPNYTFPQAYHDLALIKLTRKVIFQDFMRPVCLPWGIESQRNLVGSKVILTGWGHTTYGGKGSPSLQEVEVTVLSSQDCDLKYKNLPGYSTAWPRGIGEESLCAGESEGGKDACQGDSGGPIVSQDFQGRYTLAGIVSVGYGCGSENYPGLYANVRRPSYLSWIKKVAF